MGYALASPAVWPACRSEGGEEEETDRESIKTNSKYTGPWTAKRDVACGGGDCPLHRSVGDDPVHRFGAPAAVRERGHA